MPGNLYAQSEAYLEAASVLAKAPPRRIGSDTPLFFCIAQAAQLFFKSFLAAHGKDRALAGWRQHDLAKLQSAALRQGMILIDTAQSTIAEIAAQNCAHEFRFLETTKNLVLPPRSRSIAAVKQIKLSASDAVEPFKRVRQ